MSDTASGDEEREQRIRELAHHIWEAEGCPAGQELRHWYAATRLVEAEESSGGDDDAP
ncbi:hypothetical protein FHW84_003503 [Dyella sp. SG562]|uniref:DUF2934 domain-containing protein n=1 Tax=Dyella TaxID=231454 RepID=UPI001420D8CA|nr:MULTISPECIES: DUF2934 domain-containing protein [unclassified Dyella]NII74906.1 hypothetical protein [Dyella sp. SG562]NKJ20337.1 hypothetical protein [Dyella sp. SG609]